MKYKYAFAVFALFACMLLHSQSITGTQGQFFIPTAEMHPDRTLVLGAGYIPKGYFQRYNRSVNPGMPTFVTISLLPFVEIMFRYTHELNMRVNPETKYYPDRMFAGRIRLLKESKYIPAIVVGANDFTKALGLSTAPTNYSSTYVVGTKSFKYLEYQFATSLGYGLDVLELDRYDFLGIFGGVEIRHNQLANSSLSLEYDSKNIHLSIKLPMKKKIYLIEENRQLLNLNQMLYLE